MVNQLILKHFLFSGLAAREHDAGAFKLYLSYYYHKVCSPLYQNFNELIILIF